jgi:hypothetical protein
MGSPKMTHACTPSYVEEGKKIMVRSQTEQKVQDPVWKITKIKRAGRVAQLIDWLSIQGKALSSNPSIVMKMYIHLK